jgi:hypothetical protein
MSTITDLINTYPKIPYSNKAPLVNDVFVGKHRAVFNRDWTLNKEASHHFLYWDCNLKSREHALNGVSFDERCRKLAEKNKEQEILELSPQNKYALCTHYWNGYPFGHWFETLASLRFVPTDDFTVLCCNSSGPVTARDIDLHLEIVGIEKPRQLFVDSWKTVYCPQIYSPTIDSEIGFISREAISWLRPKYLSHKGLKLSDSPTKLYLSRNFFTHPNPDWTRSVDNEDEVWFYLKNLGYTLLKGTENILELIDAFYSAEEIVFPHGSMIYYSIFCNKKPKIIEFISEHRYREDFLYLTTINSQTTTPDKYKLIKCKADPKTNNIVIDMNMLKKEIN